MDSAIKQAIKEAKHIDDLKTIAKASSPSAFNTRDIELIYRRLQALREAPDCRIAYLANFTIDSLARYTGALGLCEGLILGEYIGPYNQYFQELLNPKSGLSTFDPDIILLTLSMRGLSPKIAEHFLELTIEQRKEERKRIVASIREWAELATSRTQATILISNFSRPKFLQAGIADYQLDYGETEFYYELNLHLLKEFKKESRVYILDLDQLLSSYGKSHADNPKMFYLAKMEWAEGFSASIANEIIRYAKAVKGMTKKCLVLDLDNTLWGGIVGEAGASGVKVEKGDPEGEAYLDFQLAVRHLKQRGIIIAISSKNNEDDALEVFTKRPDMPLNKDDFTIRRINWEHKHKNVQEIADALNIGTDSLVFMDDNPVECGMMREMLPEVKTIQLTSDPSGHANSLRSLNEFEKLILTEEDRVKNEHYRQNIQREECKRKVGSLNDFFMSLETTVVISKANEDNIARVHQLFNKTNQFNLTTKRYSITEVQTFLTAEDWELTVTRVSDRFGDSGLVGLCLIKLNNKSAVIDSFILSCRVMGRGVETAMMNRIKTDFILSRKVERLIADYYPTKKNIPVQSFYDQQGFTLIQDLENGGKRYELRSKNTQLGQCPGITIKTEE